MAKGRTAERLKLGVPGRMLLLTVNAFSLIVILLLGADLAWWWRADACLRRSGSSGMWRVGLGLFMVCIGGGLACLIGLRYTKGFLESAFPSLLFALIYVWHLLVLPGLLVGWAGVGCVSLGWRWLRCVRAPKVREGEEVPSMSASEGSLGMGRREWIGAAMASSPALIAMGATARGLATLDDFRVQKTVVPVASLPPALEGLRIAHVSDVHVGRFTRGAILEQIVAATNALEADLVCFTGDLVNYSLEDLPAGIELLKGFRARHGVFAVEGNHDLIVDPMRFRRETSAAVGLLVNERASVEVRGQTVELLGLGWGASVPKLLARGRAGGLGEAGGAFPILLAHHPHAFDEADGVPLTLSGHTHGGQLMVNERLGVGPVMFRYWSGLYRKAERALVVSNGVGNWFPLRTCAPAEITQLELRRG